MALPLFNGDGDLPIGVHRASLVAVQHRFGTTTLRRQLLAARLERIYNVAIATEHVARFVVFGSFVTNGTEPNDVDVFIVMDDAFDVGKLHGGSAILFDHLAAQARFGASIFWLRKRAALDGEEAAIAHWQIKRDGTQRGIVEIVKEAT